MPFIVPELHIKFSNRTIFSRYKYVEESPYFLLQKLKATFRSEKNPTFRIITQQHPTYEVAYGNDFDQILNNEWAYIVNQLPSLLPASLPSKDRYAWIIAHFTKLGLEAAAANPAAALLRSEPDPDDGEGDEIIPEVPLTSSSHSDLTDGSLRQRRMFGSAATASSLYPVESSSDDDDRAPAGTESGATSAPGSVSPTASPFRPGSGGTAGPVKNRTPKFKVKRVFSRSSSSSTLAKPGEGVTPRALAGRRAPVCSLTLSGIKHGVFASLALNVLCLLVRDVSLALLLALLCILHAAAYILLFRPNSPFTLVLSARYTDSMAHAAALPSTVALRAHQPSLHLPASAHQAAPDRKSVV